MNNFGYNGLIDLSKAGFGGMLSEVVFDSDAENYLSATGTTNEPIRAAVNTFVKRLKTLLAWDEIVDMGIYWGGDTSTIANAKIKLKYPGVFSSVVDDSAVSMTNSNYSHALGIRTTGANKKLNTKIVPQDHGLSKDNITLMMGMLDNINATSVYSFLDNDPVASTLYFRKDQMGAIPGISYAAPLRILTPYVNTITSNGNVVFIHDWNQHNAPRAIPDMTFDTEFSIFSGKAAGVDVFSTGSVGFHLISNYLTPEQCSGVVTAVNRLWVSLGRKSATKDCVCFGNSNTLGVGTTGTTNRYSYLLAQSLGLVEQACGIHGSKLRVQEGTILAGFDRRSIIQKYNILNGGKVYIMYGTNDCNNDTGDGTNLADFRDKLITIAQELLDFGMAPENVIIGSIPFINTATTTRQQNYRDMAHDAAASAGVYFADIWQAMNDGGGATLLSDTVHLNNAGAIVVKDTFLAAGPA